MEDQNINNKVISEESVKYKSSGFVLGNYWGGGIGAYEARKLSSDESEEDLIKLNEKALSDGSLDSGMGFKSLLGAVIYINVITTIIYKDKTFTSTETTCTFIGTLTEDQKDFLLELV